MKKLTFTVLAVLLVFTSVSMAQFTDKPKNEVKKTQTQTITVVVDSANVSQNTPVNQVVKQPVYVNLPKKEVTNVTVDSRNELNESDLASYYFPQKQYEGNVTYESQKNKENKFSGFYVSATIRQHGLNANDKNNKNRKSTFGLQLEGAKWEGEISDLNSTSIDIQEIGVLGSYARVTNRPFWNSIVINFGFVQSVENGTSDKYQWRQKDILFKTSWYIDLTRNKGIYFSSTNLSGFYLYPLSTSKSALYAGQTADYQVYNKKMLGMTVQQSILNFDLSDIAGKFALNIGVEGGYYHFSEGVQDRWSAALYAELHYNYCKLLQVSYGQKIKITDQINSSSNNGYDLVKVNADLVQVYRAIF